MKINQLSLLLVLMVFSIKIDAQNSNLECQKLLDFKESIEAQSIVDDKFYSEIHLQYCGCLETNNETEKLKKALNYTSVSAFSGGYAMATNPWHNVIVDKAGNEFGKGFLAEYIGFGYFTEKRTESVLLFDFNGKEIKTPKQFERISLVQSKKDNQIIFIGKTGLDWYLFDLFGNIKKIITGYTFLRVLNFSFLQFEINTPASSMDDLSSESTFCIMDIDGNKITGDSQKSIKFSNGAYYFSTSDGQTYVFNTLGEIKIKVTGKLLDYSKTNNLMLIETNRVNVYNTSTNQLDSLIEENPFITSDLFLTISAKQEDKRNLKFNLYSTKSKELILSFVKYSKLMNDWYLFKGTQNYYLNINTKEKVKEPKTFLEAQLLNKQVKYSVDFTKYPFFSYKSELEDDLVIYENKNHDASGKPGITTSIVYKFDFSTNYFIIKNKICKYYNSENKLIDSFPAERIENFTIKNFKTYIKLPDLLPLKFEINGKKGVVLNNGKITLNPEYTKVWLYENIFFRYQIFENEKNGLADGIGGELLKTEYEFLSTEYNTIVRTQDPNHEKSKILLFPQSPYFNLLNKEPVFYSKEKLIYSKNESGITLTNLETKKEFNLEGYERIFKVQDYFLFNEKSNSNYAITDESFKLIKSSIFNYLITPKGIVFSCLENEMNKNYFLNNKNNKLKELPSGNIQFDDRFQNQFIINDENSNGLFNENGDKISEIYGFYIKYSNLDGFLFYSSDNEIWGLMKSSGEKVTETKFESVFVGSGEHAIVWIANKRFYLNKTGKTIEF